MAHSLLYSHSAPAPRDDWARRSVLTAKDVLQTAAKTALVMATLAALYLLYLLRGLLLTVFLAIILATALRPALAWLQRRLRFTPAAAGLALYGSVTLAVLGAVVGLVPAMVGDTMALVERTPSLYSRWYGQAADLRALAEARLHLVLPALPPEPQVSAWLAGLAAEFQRSLPQLALNAAGVMGNVLLGLVLAYYWSEARDALVGLGLRTVSPEQEQRFLSIWEDIERVLGAYIGGQVMLSLLIGVASLAAYVAIGLPDPALLALVGALFHIVPLIGAFIGAIPAVLVALSISPGHGLATAVTLLLVHQVENSLIAPRVLGRQVGLSPLLMIVAITAGASLDGVAGALVAIPIAGALWILLRELLIGPRTQRLTAQGPVPTPVGPATDAWGEGEPE